MKMNPKYYPSPKALADSVHSMNAKLMISIWPNPQWCPEADDFKQRGMMLEHDIYDAFNPEARKLYWKYANDEFFANGFDVVEVFFKKFVHVFFKVLFHLFLNHGVHFHLVDFGFAFA